MIIPLKLQYIEKNYNLNALNIKIFNYYCTKMNVCIINVLKYSTLNALQSYLMVLITINHVEDDH